MPAGDLHGGVRARQCLRASAVSEHRALILSASNLLIFPGELSEDTVSYANRAEEGGKHGACC